MFADLPGVLSNQHYALIDPHEKFFTYDGERATGKRWHLADDRETLSQIPDQLAPFANLFGCTEKMLRTGCFNGTIFRFPLRQEASPLSSTIYKHDRMKGLFKSFEADAHLALVFLKKLESVELSVRESDECIPITTFVARLTPACLEQVRRKRQEFLQRIERYDLSKGASSISTTYSISIETVKFEADSDKHRQEFHYLVNEYYAGNEVSTELQTLRGDPELNFEPLVGTAMPLVKVSKPAVVAAEPIDDTQGDGPCGHVFCFLPLPVEQKSSSGLPVHVNGYFSVSQNRRHLKWPTAGQDKDADKAVYWNQCLISEVLPSSYAELLLQAIELSKKHPKALPVELVYASYPNLVEVNEKWLPLLPKLFAILFDHSVFHTAALGGRWLRVTECYFDCLKEDEKTKEAIVSVLLAADVPIVQVPKHTLHALGAFSTHSPEDVTPALVRETLKLQPSSCKNLDKAKTVLLSYILKDEDFGDLEGITLLPLANGDFATFHLRSAAVYIPTDGCPRILLPGLESCLLSEELSDKLQNRLTKVARTGEGTTAPYNNTMLYYDG